MENVHRPEVRPWISHTVNLKMFREQWMNASGNFPFGLVEEEQIFSNILKNDLNLSDSDIEELEKRCGEDELVCPHEDDIEVARSFVMPEDVNLETVRSQKSDMDKRNSDSQYRAYVYNNTKFWNYPPSKALAVTGNEASENSVANKIQLPDIMLTIQIYRPEKAMFRFQRVLPQRNPRFSVDQELCVVGDQYLTELRDKIACVSDMATPGDFSEDPDHETSLTFKDIYKSGFFYINGVFYNDMREPSSKDYSEPIRKWAETAGRGVGPFSSKKMEESKFIDLELRIGYPYVYVHQGCCEHLLVFSDLRMLTSEDPLCRDEYPLVNALIPKRRVTCMGCHTHTAKWVISKHKMLPEDPYFFCQECFKAFCYDSKNTKIGEFEAKKFVDRTLLS